MTIRTIIGLTFLIFSLNLASAAPIKPLPGIVRQSDRVFLMENHSSAYLVWHALNITNATLIHLDAHDDCRYVAPTKIQRLAELNANQDFTTLHALSDLNSQLQLKVRPDDFLFDIGNFIYPCLLDGTIRRFCWVVPNKDWNNPELTTQLRRHVLACFRLPPDTPVSNVSGGGFGFEYNNARIAVIPFDNLPEVTGNVLLDIDIDFFAFGRALTAFHLNGPLLWDPEAVFTKTAKLVPTNSIITIAGSVPGGYLPLSFRFLADASFDYLTTGRYPPYAQELLTSVQDMRAGLPSAALPPPPSDPTYIPAYSHLAGLWNIARNDHEQGLVLLRDAARASGVYEKGLLDAAEALMAQNKLQAAQLALEAERSLVGAETEGWLYANARLLALRQQYGPALNLAQRLVDWNGSTHALFLKAGILTEKGDLAAAESVYQQALQAKNDSEIALYNLALIAEQQGQLDNAANLYTRAVTLHPDFGASLENLGHALLSLNRATEAIPYLERALTIQPDKSQTLGNLGLALFRSGKPQEALAPLTRATTIDPANADLHANLGMVLHALGKNPEAMLQYRQALRTRPDWPEVRSQLDLLESSFK